MVRLGGTPMSQVVATGFDEVVDLSDMVLVTAYRRATSPPATPTGQAPEGWYINAMPPAGPGVLYSSFAYADPVNLSIITAWGEPGEAGSGALNEATTDAIAAAVPTYTPRYLDDFVSWPPTVSKKKGDWALDRSAPQCFVRYWDGSAWQQDDDRGHAAAALEDILAHIGTAGNSAPPGWDFLSTLLSDQALILALAAKTIKSANWSSGGSTGANGTSRTTIDLNNAKFLQEWKDSSGNFFELEISSSVGFRFKRAGTELVSFHPSTGLVTIGGVTIDPSIVNGDYAHNSKVTGNISPTRLYSAFSSVVKGSAATTLNVLSYQYNSGQQLEWRAMYRVTIFSRRSDDSNPVFETYMVMDERGNKRVTRTSPDSSEVSVAAFNTVVSGSTMHSYLQITFAADPSHDVRWPGVGEVFIEKMAQASGWPSASFPES